jgi:hypothetical protein
MVQKIKIKLDMGRSSRSQHFCGADVGRRQSHLKALDVGILSLGDSGD